MTMAPGHRRTKSSGPAPPDKTLVLDNGAYTIKAGFAGPGIEVKSEDCHVIPNCMARDRNRKIYIGSELSKCKDFGEIQFRRPVEKGYTVNWEAEKEIWEHEFFDKKAALFCDPEDTGLILTEAANALPVLQSHCDQVVFEEFGFARYYRAIGPTLNAYNDVPAIFKSPPRDASAPLGPAEVMLLIDSGYSHTTVTPILQGRPLQSAIRRLDVGGKLMTNYLNRQLSLRQYDMTNETHVINGIKEAACYATQDFAGDLERTWKGTLGERREPYLSGGGIAKDYVLPDYQNVTEGILRDHDPGLANKKRKIAAGKAVENPEEIMTLRCERFNVPELLFNPTDIGLRQPGLAQIVMQSLQVLPIGLWPGMLANIVVVGGNSMIDGFIHRLQAEIMALTPAECMVRLARPIDPNPIVATWHGGANLAHDEELISKLSVTKQEYDEYGAAWVAKKFAHGATK